MTSLALRVWALVALLALAVLAWAVQMKGSAEDKFAVTAGFMLLYLPMAIGAWLLFLVGEWLYRQSRGAQPSAAGLVVALAGLAVMALFALFLFGRA